MSPRPSRASTGQLRLLGTSRRASGAARTAVAAAALAALAPSLVTAQPLDPYGPPPPTPPAPVPAPAPADVDAAVAAGLLARARQLADGGELEAARQLASEAADRDPAGPTGAAARALVDELDLRLGRGQPAPVEPPGAPPVPIEPPPPAPVLPPVVDGPAPARPDRRARLLAAGYGAVGGAALGLGLAGADEDAGAGLLGGAALGGVAGYYVARRGAWTAREAHLLGTGIVWGTTAGALFADVVSGTTGTSDSDVAAGAGIGALGGAVVGGAMTLNHALTLDDVALVHSLSLWGGVAGLTTAVAIDPPEGEAYSLNAALGVAAGYVVGQLAARRADISTRRLVRINALALAGAAIPLLLWRATDDSASVTDAANGGQQAWGLLATAGLVGGAYLGFRWTRGLDRGGAAPDPSAPPALLQRGGDGAWNGGGVGLAPVRHGRGATLTLVGGRW